VVDEVAGEPDLARVLCFSEGRAEKERGIDRLKEERFLLDLAKIQKSITTGYVKDAAKTNQRVGRLLERYGERDITRHGRHPFQLRSAVWFSGLGE